MMGVERRWFLLSATIGMARDWPRSLRAYAFPRIGALPVSE